LQSLFPAVSFDKAIPMQCHFIIQGNAATQLFNPFDIFRADGFGMFYAPAQAVKRYLLIYLFQSIQKRCYVFIVTQMHTEGDSSLYQFGNILLDVMTHRIFINDNCGPVKIFVIM
jgi:hypothetical protein